MFFSQKLPPLWWFRVLTSLAFFVGGIIVTFWAQGFRFDFSQGEFVPTGVLSLSSVPSEATIVHNNIESGITPKVLLGVPSLPQSLCLQKENFHEVCIHSTVLPKTVLDLSRIHLLPKEFTPQLSLSAESIFWDPLGRGFVSFSADGTAAKVWEHGLMRIIDAPEGESFLDGVLTEQGDFLFSSLRRFSLFVSSLPSAPSSFSPQGDTFLYASNTKLFLRNVSGNTSRLLAEFPTSVQRFFFFPQSDSFLVETQENVYFSSHPSLPLSLLIEKEIKTSVSNIVSHIHFFPFGEWLFWEKDSMLHGFSFTGETFLNKEFSIE